MAKTGPDGLLYGACRKGGFRTMRDMPV